MSDPADPNHPRTPAETEVAEEPTLEAQTEARAFAALDAEGRARQEADHPLLWSYPPRSGLIGWVKSLWARRSR